MPALLLHSQALSVPQHIKNCNKNFVLDDMIGKYLQSVHHPNALKTDWYQ